MYTLLPPIVQQMTYKLQPSGCLNTSLSQSSKKFIWTEPIYYCPANQTPVYVKLTLSLDNDQFLIAE